MVLNVCSLTSTFIEADRDLSKIVGVDKVLLGRTLADLSSLYSGHTCNTLTGTYFLPHHQDEDPACSNRHSILSLDR
jgi:hypothetical protein